MMKRTIILCAAALALMAGCKQKQDADEIIGKPEVTVENGRFTPEIMWQLGKMGEFAVSPDGSKMAYTVTYYDMEKNKGNAEIYLQETIKGSVPERLTTTAQSEFNPVWKDDNTLLFARGNDILAIPSSPYLKNWQDRSCEANCWRSFPTTSLSTTAFGACL